MSRLETAEKRLHDAISRLEKAVKACVVEARLEPSEETRLRARISQLESEQDAMEKRMEVAAVRMDAMIGRLRGLLSE